MKNIAQQESDEDSAPESISFGASKSESNEKAAKMKEQINKIRESQKLKRIERQEKYIEQKKKKFENMRLSTDLLEAIDDKPSGVIFKNTKLSSNKIDTTPKSIKLDDLSENDLSKSTLSEFIPLKTYSNYGISVVNLSATNKKPLIGSEKAIAFKNIMYNRPGIRRETAQEKMAIIKKKKTNKFKIKNI